MKRHTSNGHLSGWVALCSATVLMGLAVVPARADQWDKKTILTTNQPLQVRDRVLEPGQYVFKLLNSNSDRHIVQIFNADQSHIIDTILAIPNYRLQPTGDSQFVMWETPPGTAHALRAWFYPGDNYGQEFPYPKHLMQIAANTALAAPLPAPEPEATPEPAPAPVPEAAPAPEPAPEPAPPAAEEPQTPPAPTPAPAPAPAELPHTASPFPMIGLAGLLSLGLYGVLRLKRVAR